MIPTPSILDLVCESVPRDVVVTVTASPARGIEPTLELAELLAGRGYSVVPHLSARLVHDEAHLAEIVERLLAAGVDDVFVPAGDAAVPAGAYDSALPLLEALRGLGDPFGRVGITGYPQRHPKIDDDVTIQAMWDKRHFATYLVSNLCFDARILAGWIRRVRSRGVALPMRVGIAGPVDRNQLMALAAKIGVGEASRFALSHKGSALRLGAPGGYDPDRLLRRVGSLLADPRCLVEGLHVFTFNQVAATMAWRSAFTGSPEAAP
ncbi:MAG: methylenetetrahydrofolate reductase [Acidimicrobiales bacterium]